MQQLTEEYGKKGVTVLAINVGDTVDRIRDYFAKEKFTFKPVRQQLDEISRAYAVQAYPTNVVIAPDGTIELSLLGFDEPKIRAALDRAVAKK